MKKSVEIIILCIFISIIFSSSFTLAEDIWVSQTSSTTYDLFDVYFSSQLHGVVVGGPGIGMPGFPDAMILWTDDGGNTWVEKPSPAAEQLHGICFADNDVGWAVGSGGTILKTEDGGESWTAQTSPTGGTIWDVYCMDENTAFAVGTSDFNLGSGYFGAIIGTTNGETWTSRLSGDYYELEDIHFASDDIGWAVGSDGAIFKTINGGSTWVQQSPVPFVTGITTSLSGVFCVNEDVCWVSGGGETIYKTEDGGEEWTPQSTGGAVSGISGIYFKNETTGWVAGQSVVRHTDDGGSTWVNQVSDIPGSATELDLFPVSIMRSVHFNGNVGWAVGNEGYIFRLNEPLVATFIPPNITVNRTVPQADPDRPIKEPKKGVECPAFMDDCEAGYYPLPEYNDEGCAIDYTCIREGEINLEKLSQFIGQIPGLGANERINVYLMRSDGITKEYGIIIEKNQVTQIQHTTLSKSTLQIYLSEDIVKQIMDSDDRASTAIKLYRQGDIIIKAKTFSGKIKLVFVKIFSTFKK